MGGTEKKKQRGISIKVINLSFLVIVVLFAVGIERTNNAARERYEQAMEEQKIMIACNNAANVFQKDSDELTFQAGRYVDAQDPEALERYYEVINEKLREQEIETAESYDVNCDSLREALDLSDELAETENHAFALTASAMGTLKDAPEQVRAYELSGAEKLFSSQEKLEAARDLIHGSSYYDQKQAIYDKIDEFEADMLNGTEEALLRETEAISGVLRRQHYLQLLESVLVIVMTLLFYRMVTAVLEHHIRSVSKGERMEERGAAELKKLAGILNDYMKLQRERELDLRYKAEKDELTQVANRRALEAFITQKLNGLGEYGAVVFLDIDNFKGFNDTYGHEAGDTILKTMAEIMKNDVRAGDFVGRFGGDEFVIWLDQVALENSDFISRRVEAINNRRVSIGEEEVQVTISAGVTFCRAGDVYKKVLEQADTALYEKKRHGKVGCMFYDESMTLQKSR